MTRQRKPVRRFLLHKVLPPIGWRMYRSLGRSWTYDSRNIEVLHRLTDQGNTVIIIEHNLEVIKTADWIVDLGPEGGDAGGHVVANGTPEEIAANPASYTGHYLKQVLKRRPSSKRAAQTQAAE